MTWKNINFTDTTVLFVILLIIFISAKFYFIPKAVNMPVYTITLNDADGLIIGSPVLFNGNEVGHVTKLKFEDNQVHVTFVFKSDYVKKIPKKSEVTIKATGIAASKALEIYHDPINIKEDIFVRDSIRQAAADNVQVNINRQIINAANSMNVKMSDKQLVEVKKLAQDGIVTSGIIKIIDKVLNAEKIFQEGINNTKLKEINKKLEQAGDANTK